MNSDSVRRTERAPHGSTDDLNVLDFSANTNPCVPDGVADVYLEAFESARRYPPEPPAAFCRGAASYVGCDPAQVVPTPGGLAAIRRVVSLTIDAGESVAVPFPSFSEYAREVRLHGGEPSFVPQERILETDPTDHALVIVCNPNNPTGNAYPAEALEAFAQRCRDADTPLLVDEAFLDFTDRPSLSGTDGVIVARSLTKMFGLPGIRAGFAVATGDVLALLEAARRPWNVSTPALKTGTYCLSQRSFVRETRARVRTERARIHSRLSDRFDIYPSESPFLLLDVGDRRVSFVLERAREHGLVLRDATTFRGLDSHVRVAVRLPAENDHLIEVLEDV